MGELTERAAWIGARIGGTLGGVTALMLTLIAGPIALVAAGIGIGVGATWGVCLAVLVAALISACPRVARSHGAAAICGGAVSAPLTWAIALHYGASVAAIMAVVAAAAGALGGFLLVTGPAAAEPYGPARDHARHADLAARRSLLDLARRNAAIAILAGATLVGVAWGGVRGWAHLPTFPIALVEGGLLGGAAGAALALPVFLGFGLARLLCSGRAGTHAR